MNAAVPAGVAGTFWLAGVTKRVGAIPVWVTVTVAVGAPEPVTVIVATLLPTPANAVYVAVIVPLLLPEGVTVHQLWLLDAFHVVFEVTVNGVVPAADATF